MSTDERSSHLLATCSKPLEIYKDNLAEFNDQAAPTRAEQLQGITARNQVAVMPNEGIAGLRQQILGM